MSSSKTSYEEDEITRHVFYAVELLTFVATLFYSKNLNHPQQKGNHLNFDLVNNYYK